MLTRAPWVTGGLIGALLLVGFALIQPALVWASCADVPSCIRDLKSNDPTRQGEAIFRLGNLHSSEAAAPLIGVVRGDEDDDVRRAAIQALGNLGVPEAVAALKPLLRDAVFRQEVIQALVRIKDPTAVEALIEGLRHPEIQLAAAQALGELAAPAAKPALIRLIRTTRDERIRGVASLAVQKINSYWGPSEEEMGLPIYPEADYIPNSRGDWIFMTRASVDQVADFYQTHLKRPALDFAGFVRQYEKRIGEAGNLERKPDAVIVAREQSFAGHRYASVLIFVKELRNETEIRIYQARGGD